MKVSSITIVTPCRNAEHLIRVTAESILAQTAVRSGRLALQYIVCDGASGDRTLDVVREVCGDRAEIISAPDRSMYDGLTKGLRRATGDVVAYLNAGDFYHPGAFDVVADVIESGRARWLTGMYYVCNEHGQLVRSLLPHRFRRRAIRQGVYGRFLPVFVQQETTFWTRDLLRHVDLDRLASLRLAGDFYLWKCFAAHDELAVVDTFLGAFVRHPGQLSEDKRPYRAEMDAIREHFRPWDLGLALWDAAVWLCVPSRAKRVLNRRTLFQWDDRAHAWR
ncbi:glycosyltransferase [Anaeromyxobacter sp. K]|uniref:glycosyltransferase n=1 Tax=Anaeromyxobacter sp. (strain K) TaxID=447217 RepID=UPI000311BA76|nr:glycosyltransferase [Anaeromyxobacter sp. K]